MIKETRLEKNIDKYIALLSLDDYKIWFAKTNPTWTENDKSDVSHFERWREGRVQAILLSQAST